MLVAIVAMGGKVGDVRDILTFQCTGAVGTEKVNISRTSPTALLPDVPYCYSDVPYWPPTLKALGVNIFRAAAIKVVRMMSVECLCEA